MDSDAHILGWSLLASFLIVSSRRVLKRYQARREDAAIQRKYGADRPSRQELPRDTMPMAELELAHVPELQELRIRIEDATARLYNLKIAGGIPFGINNLPDQATYNAVMRSILPAIESELSQRFPGVHKTAARNRERGGGQDDWWVGHDAEQILATYADRLAHLAVLEAYIAAGGFGSGGIKL